MRIKTIRNKALLRAAAWSLLASALAAPRAGAGVVQHTVMQDLSNMPGILVFPGFDSSLGTLQDVTLNLSETVLTPVSLDFQGETTAAETKILAEQTLSVHRPSGPVMATLTQEGTLPFPAGTTLSVVLLVLPDPTPAQETFAGPVSSLADFISSGGITMTTDGLFGAGVTPNLGFLGTPQTNTVTATLTYVYAAGAAAVPEPASFGLLATAAAALASYRATRRGRQG